MTSALTSALAGAAFLQQHFLAGAAFTSAFTSALAGAAFLQHFFAGAGAAAGAAFFAQQHFLAGSAFFAGAAFFAVAISVVLSFYLGENIIQYLPRM